MELCREEKENIDLYTCTHNSYKTHNVIGICIHVDACKIRYTLVAKERANEPTLIPVEVLRTDASNGFIRTREEKGNYSGNNRKNKNH